MQRVIVFMLVSLVMLACGSRSSADTAIVQNQQVKDCVEVLLFHGKQRCVTCRMIEQGAQALVNAQFAEQVKQGKVVMRVVDFSKKENEALAEKYQVAFSSLILVQHKGGKEKTDNLTELAFANARTNPDVFKAELQKRINEALK